jgi:hypothetical protein
MITSSRCLQEKASMKKLCADPRDSRVVSGSDASSATAHDDRLQNHPSQDP